MIFIDNEQPNFDGSIVLMFPKAVSQSSIETLFEKNIDFQVYENTQEMTYVEVKDYCCWEVNDFLTVLFKKCNFEILLFARSHFDAKILIDITFQHNEKYPSLLFDGANMEKIHMLHADISIDIY